MALAEALIRYRRFRLIRLVLVLTLNIDFPAAVKVGRGLRMVHRGHGTVLTPHTVIGDDVHIYHQVTIGQKDAHIPYANNTMERVEIGNGVILFPGAKVLGGAGVTRVGDGTIVAANAVLLQSTGEHEIWGGIPARRIGNRPPVARTPPE